jgi:hypothetical protein
MRARSRWNSKSSAKRSSMLPPVAGTVPAGVTNGPLCVPRPRVRLQPRAAGQTSRLRKLYGRTA